MLTSVQKHERLRISQSLTGDSIYYIDHLIQKLHDIVNLAKRLEKVGIKDIEDDDDHDFRLVRFYLAELRVCYGAILAHPELQTWLRESEQDEWLAKFNVLKALRNATPALEFHNSVIEKLSRYGILCAEFEVL